MTFLDTILGMLGTDNGGAPPSQPQSFDDRFPQSAAPVMPQPDPMQAADAGMPPGGIPIPRPRPPEAGPAANELDTVPPPQPRNVSLLPDSNAPPQSQGGLMQAVLGAPQSRPGTSDDPSAMLRDLLASRQRSPVSTFLTSLGGGLANLKNSPFKGQVAANSFGGATQASNEADKEDFDQRAKALGLALQIKAANGKPSFTKIGQGAFNEEQYGFVDPNTKSVTPYSAPNGTPAATTLGATAPDGTPATPATGDAALQGMPVPMRELVKKITNYEVDPRTLSVKGGHRERVLAAVAQYDPSYDQAQYASRAGAIKEFNSGGPNSPAGNITAGNTAIQHLGQLSDISEKIGGTDNAWILNSVANKGNAAYLQAKNDPNYKEYQATLGRFAEEATKFYRGIGGSEKDIQRAIDNVTAAQSPEARRAAIHAEADLMQSKINALQARYQTATNPRAYQKMIAGATANNPDFPVVQQKSAEQLERIRARRDPDATVSAARAAIAKGAPRDEVIKRLNGLGLDTTGL